MEVLINDVLNNTGVQQIIGEKLSIEVRKCLACEPIDMCKHWKKCRRAIVEKLMSSAMNAGRVDKLGDGVVIDWDKARTGLQTFVDTMDRECGLKSRFVHTVVCPPEIKCKKGCRCRRCCPC